MSKVIKYIPLVVAAVIAVVNVLTGANVLHFTPHTVDVVNGVLVAVFGAGVHVNL